MSHEPTDEELIAALGVYFVPGGRIFDVLTAANAIRDARWQEQINAQAKRIAELELEIARLREALNWYDNPNVYRPNPHGPAFDRRDLSFVARAALQDTQP